jgi:hypothetical protein
MTSHSTTVVRKSCAITLSAYLFPHSPVTRHISSAYSPIPILHVILTQPVTNLLPSTSSPRYPLANQCGQTYPLSLLTCPPCPNGYPFAQIILFFTFSSPFMIQMPLKSSSSSPFHLLPPLTSGHHSQRHSFSDFCRYQLKGWRQSPNIQRSMKIHFSTPCRSRSDPSGRQRLPDFRA